jgi:phospholipid-binding lipoprotein MlaA
MRRSFPKIQAWRAAVVSGAVLTAAAGPAMAQTPHVRHAVSPRGQSEAQSAPAPAAADPVNAAPVPDGGTALIPDPWSGPNHSFYRLTRTVDRAVIAPVIRGYVRVVPTPVRNGLDNAIRNLQEPRTVANDVLQGRFTPAGRATARFAINSTIGVAGLVDVAGRAGIQRHESDFGQTLGRYGVRSGPYIFVPLAGPTSLRDGAGRLVDIFADPLGLLAGGLGTTFGDVRTGVAAMTERTAVDDQLQQVDSEFTDPYASIRSVYSQQRASQIETARGHPQGDVDRLPDFAPAPANVQPRRPEPDLADPTSPNPSLPCSHPGCS